MSLAIYAAPFDNTDSNNDVTNTYSTAVRRRNVNNRTQKQAPQEDTSYNANKVNSVLNAIHNSNTSSSSSELADFKPLAPPVSVGVENTRINNPDTSVEDDLDLQNLNANHMNEQAKEEYYKH